MSETVVVESIRPLAAVLVSALAALLILGSSRSPNIRESWSVAAAVVKFGIVASMIPGVLNGTEYRWSMGQFVAGVEFALRADMLGMLFATLASFLWIATAFYTTGYMRGLNEDHQTRFFAAFAASLSTAIGIAFGENLLTVFIFYELLSLVTYPLVAHDETAEARAAGRKYLAYTFFGGGVMVLGGTALVYGLTGTLTFGETGAGLATADPMLAQAAFGLLVLGFGTKAAIMPFHSWLPDAMVAPTPVSGLLHAVAVVKSGAFGVSRVLLHVYEPELTAELGMHIPLAALAAFTFIVASLIALRKDHLKQRLAYSTVSQLSYIIMGLALLTPYGITGGLLHIPAHAFMKLTLFFCAGAVHVETHTDYISKMAGIGKRMPLTFAAFAVASAGMAGIPLVSGFVSKFYLLIGSVHLTDAGMAAAGAPTIAGLVFAAALIVSGVLNIAYFWPVVYTAFFETPGNRDPKPVLDALLGGRDPNEADAQTENADYEYEHDTDTGHDNDHGHGHQGGAPGGGWEQRMPWTESTWLMLAPITLIVIGALVLGIVPQHAVFLDYAINVAEAVTGMEVSMSP